MKEHIRGFSLIEFLTTLVVIAILLIISIPPLASFYKKHTHQYQAMRLFHTLQFARTQAIKRQQNIGVCPSGNGVHCDSDWSLGYIVYVADKNKKDLAALQVLRVEKNSSAVQIETPSLQTIVYTREGRCLSRGSFYIDRHGKEPQKIILYDSGRSRIEAL